VLSAPALPGISHIEATVIEPVHLLGIPVDFILFALTLLGVALFHRHTLPIALTGLATLIVYKLAFTGFKFGAGLGGLGQHMAHEWVMLTNLFLLLMGFALLSRHFEESRIPDEMPGLLPDDWTGGVALLFMVFVLSSFLDNIAAALIGGTVARHVFQGKVHIGYLAAIVAASNAGGFALADPTKVTNVIGNGTGTLTGLPDTGSWSINFPDNGTVTFPSAAQPIDFARGEGLVFANLLNQQGGGPLTSEATHTVRTGEPPSQGPTTDIFVNTDQAAMPLDLAFMIVVLRFPQQSTHQA
jgi:hypothetical protein